MGIVKSIGSGSFTLAAQNGTTVTVNVGSATTFVDPGVKSPTAASVTVGEHVAVFGTESENTVSATTVAIGLPPKGGKGAPGGGPGNGPGGPGGPGGRGGNGGPPPMKSGSGVKP
jgi:hypothetical protein